MAGPKPVVRSYLDRAADYHVVTHWRVAATGPEIATIFRDVASLSRWWPAVFLDVEVLQAGGPAEVGLSARLHTKGWLPYTLRLRFSVVDASESGAFTLVVDGDLEGSCVCRAMQRDGVAELRFDWRVRVTKPIVRGLSPLFRHVFIRNHLWVMARGQESLAIEVMRRRAEHGAAGASVPTPRGPTFPYTPSFRPIMNWLFAARHTPRNA